ncbi:MAG: hypothetical protein QOF77_206 [Solirubrobacteraceae bacterium]|jgi:hypothetical protein|nr:hypothetical protein [Solirubrobacteraceae bacterium]
MGRSTGTRRVVLLSVSAVVAAGISGCAMNGFGAGTIGSSDGVATDRAAFTINYHITNYHPSTGVGSGVLSGVYVDSRAAGGPVRLKFDGLTGGLGPCTDQARALGLPASVCAIVGADEQCFAGTGRYVSLDSANPGSGQVGVVGCDNGRAGAPSTDTLSVNVISGPYSGYSNGPKPVVGNLTTK